MRNRTYIPVIRILLPLAAGLCLGFSPRFPEGFTLFLHMLSLLHVLLLLGIHLKWPDRPGGRLAFALLALNLYVSLGILLAGHTRPSDPALDPALDPDSPNCIIGDIADEPGESVSSGRITFTLESRFVFDGDTLRELRTSFRTYLPAGRWSGVDSLPKKGESWCFSGRLIPIKNNVNPGETDFERIWQRKNIWYRFYPAYGRSLDFSLGSGFRRMLSRSGLVQSAIWEHWGGKKERKALLQALCLGDKSALSREQKENFARAGAMHLLAVSGLHTGMIWWIIRKICLFLLPGKRAGALRKGVVFILLWCYAWLTGFSPSVSRSVSMFSFFTLSDLGGQRIPSLNHLFVSAFFLLIIKPVWILEPGFQLSYAAMFGILSLYPRLIRKIRLRKRIWRYLRDAFCVSLSAQLFTLPLVLYYFHQLPVYSLITSLWAIPLLSIILAVFVLSFPLSLAGLGEEWTGQLLAFLAGIMDSSIARVASWPGAIVEGFYPDSSLLAFWMAALCCFFMIWYGRRRWGSYLLLLLLAGAILWQGCRAWQISRTGEVLCAHFRGGSLVSFREGKKVDHYYRAGDPGTLSFMQKYMEEAWSSRSYQNQYYPLSEQYHIAGQVSSCQVLGPGVSILGNERLTGWICTASPPDLSRQSLSPDFILLCAEADPIQWLSVPMGGIPVIVDGSIKQVKSVGRRDSCRRLFLTGEQGAWVKRWKK